MILDPHSYAIIVGAACVRPEKGQLEQMCAKTTDSEWNKKQTKWKGGREKNKKTENATKNQNRWLWEEEKERERERPKQERNGQKERPRVWASEQKRLIVVGHIKAKSSRSKHHHNHGHHHTVQIKMRASVKEGRGDEEMATEDDEKEEAKEDCHKCWLRWICKERDDEWEEKNVPDLKDDLKNWSLQNVEERNKEQTKCGRKQGDPLISKIRPVFFQWCVLAYQVERVTEWVRERKSELAKAVVLKWVKAKMDGRA